MLISKFYPKIRILFYNTELLWERNIWLGHFIILKCNSKFYIKARNSGETCYYASQNFFLFKTKNKYSNKTSAMVSSRFDIYVIAKYRDTTDVDLCSDYFCCFDLLPWDSLDYGSNKTHSESFRERSDTSK